MIRVLFAGKPAGMPRYPDPDTGGIHAEIAGSARDSLEMLRNKQFDLIVSDLHLPDMDCSEFLEQVQKLSPGIPLLFGPKDFQPNLLSRLTGAGTSACERPAVCSDPFPDRTSGIPAQGPLQCAPPHEDFLRILKKIPGGILVISEGVIVFSNESLRRMLGITRPHEIEGHLISEFICATDQEMAFWRLDQPANSNDLNREFSLRVLHLDGSVRYLSSKVSPIEWNHRPATVFFFDDITDSRKSQAALALASRKMGLLTGITRHDITNRLTVVRARLKRARIGTEDPQVIRELEDAEQAARDIFRYLDMAHTYQDMGMAFPQWFSLRSILDCSRNSAEFRNLSIAFDSVNVDIFADPLCPRVFENLFDNSLRHGKTVSEIRVRTRKTNGGLVILLEDNGCGIAESEKDAVFEQGVGRNTGMGLFFSREILSITGITIQETGTFGNGARFEISVPSGAFRPGNPARAAMLPCI